MLFSRRTPEGLLSRIRLHLWPRRSFARSGQYFWKRVMRLRATPHAIALGVATGVFAAFLPFVGLHILIAAALAWMLRGSMVAAALGTTMIGNPLTFPLIWGGTYTLGRLLLHAGPASATPLHLGERLQHMDVAALWHPLLEPMTIGAFPLGIAAAVILYFPTRLAVAAFRNANEARRTKDGRHWRTAAQPIVPPVQEP
jgi:uncharacterized protein (DUF2062 family)